MINVEYLREADHIDLVKAKGRYMHILNFDDGIYCINNDPKVIFRQTREVNNEDHTIILNFETIRR